MMYFRSEQKTNYIKKFEVEVISNPGPGSDTSLLEENTAAVRVNDENNICTFLVKVGVWDCNFYNTINDNEWNNLVGSGCYPAHLPWDFFRKILEVYFLQI